MVSVDVKRHVYVLSGPLESDDAFQQTFGPLGDQVTFQLFKQLKNYYFHPFLPSGAMTTCFFLLCSILFLQHSVGKANKGGVTTWRYPG